MEVGLLSLLYFQTRTLLRQAVHRQMISDVPVGAFLSGGLDSTSIVAFAREVDPNIQCFTISMENASDDGFVDDLPFAVEAAKYLNVPLSIVKIDPYELIHNIEDMVWMLDEPLADPACLNLNFISRFAASKIKVLLSGAGGDDLFMDIGVTLLLKMRNGGASYHVYSLAFVLYLPI